MATRQYVGARYVPKFYNYNGSSEWVSGMAYEPLTIVTRNGNSYTSKIPVPANIGEPENNPDYWVATGIYNQQIEYYRQETNEVKESLDEFMGEGAIGTNNISNDAITSEKINDGAITGEKIDNEFLKTIVNNCVTPEMYGAIGDGVNDDTEALQNCIVSGNCVVLRGIYRITASLNFNNISNLAITGGKITRDTDQTFNTISGNNCHNILIKGVEFDGNGNKRDMSYTWRDHIQGCILLASQSQNIFIEKCKISNFNYGVFILGEDVENSATTFNNTSLNGYIKDCTFYNCNSAIDTYGKGIEIAHNTLYDITEHAIQIEPNGTQDDNVTNPLLDPNYYMCGACSVIRDNLCINIAGICINIHPNTYGTVVENNTCIDIDTGVYIHNGSKGVIITNNTIINQKDQTYTIDKRPWGYQGAISCFSPRSIISNNYVFKCVLGILSCGGTIIDNNIIELPYVSGIVRALNVNGYQGSLAFTVTNNAILRHANQEETWWASRAIVIGAGEYNFITNNIIQSSDEPLRIDNSAKVLVDGLFSTVQQVTVIPASGYYNYNNLSS